MPNRKLVELKENFYAYMVNGIVVDKGPAIWITAVMQKDGITETHLAIQLMKQYKHDVADFGIAGRFIYSDTFDNVDFGTYIPLKEV